MVSPIGTPFNPLLVEDNSEDSELTEDTQSTSTLAAASSRHPFDRKVDALKPSKADINAVIMDYLVSEGFPAAAQSFAVEANISQLQEDRDFIRVRVDIKKAIHTGNIQQAIELINELNPEILDLDHALHFALLRLQLIELIRTSRTSSDQQDIITAINFARDNLASRASINQQFKQDLEHAMCLIAFAPDKVPPHIAALLDPQLKQDVADMVNKTILERYEKSKEARIKALIKLRTWSEQKARDQRKDLPATLPIGLEGDQNAGRHEDGEDSAEEDAMVP